MPFFQKESNHVQVGGYENCVRVSVLSDGNCGPASVFAGGLLQTILTNPQALNTKTVENWLLALRQSQRGLILERLIEAKRTPQAAAFIEQWQAINWATIQTLDQLKIQFAILVALAEQDVGARELFMLGISDSLRTLLATLQQNDRSLYQPFVAEPVEQAQRYRAEMVESQKIGDQQGARERDELVQNLEAQAGCAMETLQNTPVQTDKVYLESAHLGALVSHFGLSFHSRNANALLDADNHTVLGQEVHNAENYDLVIPNAPSVTILLENRHFTPLVPADQEDVFATARCVLRDANIQIQPLQSASTEPTLPSSVFQATPISLTERRSTTPTFEPVLSPALSPSSSSSFSEPIGLTARRPKPDTSWSSNHSLDLSSSHSSGIPSSSGSSSSYTGPMPKRISSDLDDEDDDNLQLAIQESLELEAKEDPELALAIKNSLEDDPRETKFQHDLAEGIEQSNAFDTINVPRFNKMVDALKVRNVTDLLRDYHYLRDPRYNPNDDKEICDYLTTRPDAMQKEREYSAQIVNIIKGTADITTCQDISSLKTALIQTLAREATLRDSSYRYLQLAVNLSLGLSSVTLSTHPNRLLNTASHNCKSASSTSTSAEESSYNFINSP